MTADDLGLPWLSHLRSLFESESVEKNGFSGRIHIVTPDIFRIDAVSKYVIEMASILEILGFDISVYCDNCSPADRDLFLTTNRFFSEVDSARDLLIYHYSIGHKFLSDSIKVPVRKAMYFHGITPPEFLQDLDPTTAQLCKAGLDELSLAEKFDFIAANSEYNLQQISNAIRSKCHEPHRKMASLPPFFSLDRWDDITPSKVLNPAQSGRLFLYVGRMVPHKNVEACLELLASLRTLGKDDHLVLLGGISAHDYVAALKSQIRALDLEKNVHWVTDATDSDLKGYYLNASALLQFSKHEGFAIPLTEAMKLNLPLISHPCTAIPETLRGSGIMIDLKALSAEAIRVDQILQDGHARSKVVEEQNSVYRQNFSDEACKKRFVSWLSELVR